MPPSFHRNEITLCFAGSFVFILAAWFSHGYINLDEHFQVIEFLGYKLKFYGSSVLTWEFETSSRSWFPAAIFYFPAKLLMAMGVENPVTIVRGLRVLTSMLAIVSVIFHYYVFRDLIKSNRLRMVFLSLLFFLCIMPSYHARTSSENLSAVFMILSLSMVLFSNQSKKLCLLAGLFASFAFLARYQIGFMIAGLWIWWFVFQSKGRSLWLQCLGFFVGLLFGMAIDFWGYGKFEFVPWNYLNIQLLQGKVNEFGVAPWYHYFELLYQDVPRPFGLMMFITTVTYWFKFPRQLLTWVTLPFVIGHFMVGHKEVRFLIPLFYLTPFMFCELANHLSFKIHRSIISKMVTCFTGLLLLVNFGFLVKEVFVAKMPELAVVKEIYDRKISTLHYKDQHPYYYQPLTMHFYKPPKLVDIQGANFVPGEEYFLYTRVRGNMDVKEDSCVGNLCALDCSLLFRTPSFDYLPEGLRSHKALQKNVFRTLSLCRMGDRRVRMKDVD